MLKEKPMYILTYREVYNDSCSYDVVLKYTVYAELEATIKDIYNKYGESSVSLYDPPYKPTDMKVYKLLKSNEDGRAMRYVEENSQGYIQQGIDKYNKEKAEKEKEHLKQKIKQAMKLLETYGYEVKQVQSELNV